MRYRKFNRVCCTPCCQILRSPKMALDRRFLNVILLGFGFMFVFTAFQTMGNIQKTVLDSISIDDPTFQGDGYTSLAVIYAVFALCNWLTPSIISLTGPRVAMVIGGITYCLYILSFLYPQTWLLYVASCVIGFGAAVIWTGQGTYLTLNSDSTTISRNSGIFWAMLQCSMFFGNIYVYFKFAGKTHIDADTRFLVFIVLGSLAAIGIVFLLCLRPAINSDGELAGGEGDGPLAALKRALELFTTKEMLFLCVTFLYTGIELSFFSGVYGPSIGFTLSLGSDVKQLVGLSGIFIGLGEVIGGASFGILGQKTIRWGRDPIVITGYFVHVLAFFLIFLNLPDSAPFQDTEDLAFITSSGTLAMFCSFLLGFGDSCFNTQIYSILGSMFPQNSAPAFAIFKFTQSVAAASCFFYSSHCGLYIQLGILTFFATLGTLSFCYVEWVARRKRNSGYNGAIDSPSDLDAAVSIRTEPSSVNPSISGWSQLKRNLGYNDAVDSPSDLDAAVSIQTAQSTIDSSTPLGK